jgi:hypothetical protein
MTGPSEPPDDWQRLWEVFHAALDREPSERAAFLDAACGGDARLRREIGELLAAHASDGILDQPVTRDQPARPAFAAGDVLAAIVDAAGEDALLPPELSRLFGDAEDDFVVGAASAASSAQFAEGEGKSSRLTPLLRPKEVPFCGRPQGVQSDSQPFAGRINKGCGWVC